MTYWQDRRVLVTGGAGFIGANVVRRLLHEGARVRVADNLGRLGAANLDGIEREIELVRVDLREPAGCAQAVSGMAAIFHLASNVGNIDHYRNRAGEVLIQNTLIDAQMLSAAMGAGVERYLYASSTHVYPQHLQQRPDAPALREDDAIPADPPVSYGWAKLLGEQTLQAVTEQGALRGAVLRMMNPYGPYMDIDPDRASAIPAFVRRVIELPSGGVLALRSSGEETRTFCFVDDTVEAMLRAMERLDDHMFVGPLNVGSEQPVSILALAREIVSLSGKAITVQPAASAPLIPGQTIDCSRARAELGGWTPVVQLQQGLQRMFGDITARIASHT